MHRRPHPTWFRLLLILCYWFALGTGGLLVWACADQSPQISVTSSHTGAHTYSTDR